MNNAEYDVIMDQKVRDWMKGLYCEKDIETVVLFWTVIPKELVFEFLGSTERDVLFDMMWNPYNGWEPKYREESDIASLRCKTITCLILIPHMLRFVRSCSRRPDVVELMAKVDEALANRGQEATDTLHLT